MVSLPVDLLSKLRKMLTDSVVFSNDHELRAVFFDPRLEQWRNQVPNAHTPLSRFSFLLSALLNNWNTDGDNAFYLFLCVLSEQLESRELAELALEARDELLRQKIVDWEQRLTQLEKNLQRGRAKPDYATKRRAQIQEEIQKCHILLANTPPLCFGEAKAS